MKPHHSFVYTLYKCMQLPIIPCWNIPPITELQNPLVCVQLCLREAQYIAVNSCYFFYILLSLNLC